MWFFSSLYRSLFDLRWLKKTKNNSAVAWSYFFLFIFLLAGLVLVPMYVRLPSELKKVRVLAEQNVPNFQLEVKDGQLILSDLPQPYTFQKEDFVLVVDTATTTNLKVSDYLQGEKMSGVVVTKDKAEIYNAPNKTTQVQYWKELPNYKTSKSELLVLADKWLKPLMLWVIGLVMFLGLYIGLTVTKLLSLLLVVWLVWVINTLTKKGWSFKQLFNTGLFALTLPSILLTALGWVGGQISFVYSVILFLVMMVVVFWKEKK